MTIKGKIFMWAFIALLGFSTGGYLAFKAGHKAGYTLGFKAGEEAGYRAKANEGNQINLSVEGGKVKKGGEINFNVEGNTQSQEKVELPEEKPPEEKKRWKLF